jgi:hypothetical protein
MFIAVRPKVITAPAELDVATGHLALRWSAVLRRGGSYKHSVPPGPGDLSGDCLPKLHCCLHFLEHKVVACRQMTN